MEKKQSFAQGEVVKYTGKGFIGFRKNDREMVFVRYDGEFSAYVKYDGYNVLVYVNELEKMTGKQSTKSKSV